MQQTCTQCSTAFEITPDDLAFYDKVSPVFNGKKELIPPPTLCPECRMRRRLAWRNERTLYRRPCDASGKSIISCYSSHVLFVVHEREHWLNVDNTQFGRAFDFSRSFFEQLFELYAQTIKSNVIQNGEMQNSSYTHCSGWLKNCYLLFDSGKSEDSLYGVLLSYSKNCLDGLHTLYSELCYNVTDVMNGYHVIDSSHCRNCSFTALSRDCIGCKHCIGCANLRNKEFHIANEPVTKELFWETWNTLFAGSHAALAQAKESYAQFLLTQPVRFLHNIHAEGCTGDYLQYCENTYNCFDCSETRNIRYCQNVFIQTEACQDVSTFGENMEYCYELSACGGVKEKIGMSNCYFSLYAFYGGHMLLYSMNCHDDCKYCFGCSDLRGKQFCILNKQYTKEEYEALVPKIIEKMRADGEWGEFFPVTMSPFAYNETVAQEYFPLTKGEVLARGWKWRDQTDEMPKVDKIIPAAQLPDSIDDIPDDILNWAIECDATKRPFKIIKQELEFYRQMRLPVPRYHPDERHRRRMALRNPRKLWSRNCMKCQKEIETSYAPDRPEIVYCESCYLASVY